MISGFVSVRMIVKHVELCHLLVSASVKLAFCQCVCPAALCDCVELIQLYWCMSAKTTWSPIENLSSIDPLCNGLFACGCLCILQCGCTCASYLMSSMNNESYCTHYLSTLLLPFFCVSCVLISSSYSLYHLISVHGSHMLLVNMLCLKHHIFGRQ